MLNDKFKRDVVGIVISPSFRQPSFDLGNAWSIQFDVGSDVHGAIDQLSVFVFNIYVSGHENNKQFIEPLVYGLIVSDKMVLLLTFN